MKKNNERLLIAASLFCILFAGCTSKNVVDLPDSPEDSISSVENSVSATERTSEAEAAETNTEDSFPGALEETQPSAPTHEEETTPASTPETHPTESEAESTAPPADDDWVGEDDENNTGWN